ncbi:MAG: DUF2807 domain-containing protein, partial [Muribaculaceae bacterium]|nr:DUF2807 domain-containing protein [Muribaculaceae bacterium]
IKIVGATATNMTLDMAGVGTVNVDGLKADCCNVHSSGSGRIIITGQAEMLTIKSSGAGAVNCLDLNAETVQVHSSGSGTVSVCKTDNLTVEKAGYGSVNVGSGDSKPITINGNRVVIKNPRNGKK